MGEKRILGLCVLALLLALGMLLPACGQEEGSGHAELLTFAALMAEPQRYAGEYVCIQGVYGLGFEMSGLAASTYEEDGYRFLTEPVIWVAGADVRSREDCTRTEADPSIEFCQAVACGVFETGGTYGHLGGYDYQLRGSGASALPSRQVELCACF
jgi:hypothetical protein